VRETFAGFDFHLPTIGTADEVSLKKKKKQNEGRDGMIILVDKISKCNSNKGIAFIFVLDIDTAALLNTERF